MSNIDVIVEYKDFESMSLKLNLLRGILTYGFEKPSKIQQKVIIPIIAGQDVIAQSQSGTGKTGAFVISLLEKVDPEIGGCQGIIVSPTRELAKQSIRVCEALGSFMGINIVSCIGKTSIRDNRRDLSSGTIIAVGTPGRIIDMINREYLNTSYVQTLVLDEADELLQNNFRDQIESIVTSLPGTTQICLFSATMPEAVVDLTKQFMKDPLAVLVEKEKLTLAGIKQYYVNVKQNKWKIDTICDLYKWISVNQSIIYANSISRVKWLRDGLVEHNYTVSIIHGQMTADERHNVMSEFRNGTTRVLISTDLLSRGIDIHRVAMVINYDIPSNYECYLHRIGRSGRYGRRGVAISFVTQRDYRLLKDIETFYKTKIEPMPNPENIIF